MTDAEVNAALDRLKARYRARVIDRRELEVEALRIANERLLSIAVSLARRAVERGDLALDGLDAELESAGRGEDVAVAVPDRCPEFAKEGKR